jgi:hypothetical protein
LLSLAVVAVVLVKVQRLAAVAVQAVFLLPPHLLCHLEQPTQLQLAVVALAQLT